MINIKEKISNEKESLIKIISKYGLDSAIALEKSKELDKLILEATKIELQNKALNTIK